MRHGKSQMEHIYLHMQMLKDLTASGASPESAFPNQRKVRGKGRGRGKGKPKQPKLDDSDGEGEREQSSTSLCDARMAALLHASVKLDSDALSKMLDCTSSMEPISHGVFPVLLT